MAVCFKKVDIRIRPIRCRAHTRSECEAEW